MRSPRNRDRGGAAVEEDIPDWISTVSTNSSTVATTASLASRIANLAIDLEDAAKKDELLPFREEEEEDEEVVIEVSEELVLQMLDSQEDPFQVCSRLFNINPNNPMQLKRINIRHVEEFKQHGYLVLDNFISKETAMAIHKEAINLNKKGRLTEASKFSNAKFQDNNARGDQIMWLHMGQPPCDSPPFSQLLVSLQELQCDLQEFVKIKNQSIEFQLAMYPGNGTSYAKHRDAFPDSSSDSNQRKITAIVYVNYEWKAEDGGALRIYPPRKNAKVNHVTHLEQRHRNTVSSESPALSSLPSEIQQQLQQQQQQQQNRLDNVVLRPPPFPASSIRAGSDYPYSSHGLISEPDISMSDPSECGSLRSEGLDTSGHVLGIPKSTTSSVMAEVGLLMDGQFDVSSVDDVSVASLYHEQAKLGIDWVEVDGGMVMEVAPLAGRVVLFLSGAVDHAVKPTFNDRIAITAWYT